MCSQTRIENSAKRSNTICPIEIRGIEKAAQPPTTKQLNWLVGFNVSSKPERSEGRNLKNNKNTVIARK